MQVLSIEMCVCPKKNEWSVPSGYFCRLRRLIVSVRRGTAMKKKRRWTASFVISSSAFRRLLWSAGCSTQFNGFITIFYGRRIVGGQAGQDMTDGIRSPILAICIHHTDTSRTRQSRETPMEEDK